MSHSENVLYSRLIVRLKSPRSIPGFIKRYNALQPELQFSSLYRFNRKEIVKTSKENQKSFPLNPSNDFGIITKNVINEGVSQSKNVGEILGDLNNTGINQNDDFSAIKAKGETDYFSKKGNFPQFSEHTANLYGTLVVTTKGNNNHMEEWYNKFQSDGAVKYVQYDQGFELAAQPPQNSGDWWMNAINCAPLILNYTPANQIKVAIIDTFIDTSHPDLIGKFGTGDIKDFTGLQWGPKGPLPESIGNTMTPDAELHGTHVAGIIGAINNSYFTVGLANMSGLMCLRVFPNAYESSLAVAVRSAVDNGANVINASWISRLVASNPNGGLTLKDAIDYACSKGVVFICAAGNDSTTADVAEDVSNFFPAGFDNVITVGSVKMVVIDNNTQYVKADSSNFGTNVVGAPGVKIVSLKAKDYDENLNMNGTSMATAFVTALVARMLAVNPGLAISTTTQCNIAQTLRSHFKYNTIGPDKYGKNFSPGMIDFGLTLGSIPSVDPGPGGSSG